MNLIIGSHVSFNSKKQLLGSVEEALSYNANTFMIYTGGAQSTIRSNINDEYTYEAFKLMIENNINPKNVIVHAPYIVNLANKSDERKYEYYIEFLINELNRVKKLCQKGASFAIKALPVIVPAFLLFHTNSTCCIVNGQPTPPNSIKKYRKF